MYNKQTISPTKLIKKKKSYDISKCITLANTSAIRQQVAHITDQFSSPSCLKKHLKTRATQKKSLYLEEDKSLKTFLESRQETGPKAEKGEDRRSNRTRQNNQREVRKVESNDSREIPQTPEVPNLPSGRA